VARDQRARLAAAARVAAAPVAAKAAVIAAVPACAFLLCALLLAALVAISAGSASAPCGHSLDSTAVPAQLVPIYERASGRYRLGPRGVSILAAINKIETGFGQNQGPSSAGALGWMQFMPRTWAAHGLDADGDGMKDPADPDDAIHAAARYLRASGAPADWHRAIFAYNHAEWYVQQVLAQSEAYAGGTAPADGGAASCEPADVRGVEKVAGGGAFVPIPGFPGEQIDRRLLDDIAYLERRYRIFVTDAYAPTGHAAAGEHPIGLAADIVPGPGGSWADVDRLARWAEPEQGKPRPPWRWVGYNGDPDHGNPRHCPGGCPAHLHLSWQHSEPTTPGQPADWVLVLDLEEQP
jgi:hypothetical protein